MPLSDVDLIQRHFSVGLEGDLVDFIVYSYDEQTFEENYFKSADDLIDLLGKQREVKKSYWIEVINRSSVELPNNMKTFCDYFDIHPLIIEDITTIAPYMKLDLLNDQAAVYLLMKIISWNGHRVQQQQISFYLKYSKNILITFQERGTGIGTCFDYIRNRLQRLNSSEEQSPHSLQNRLKQMNVEYLFYCLLDTIIERYTVVFEEIAIRIDQYDEKLMRDKQSLSMKTLHSIYHIKHDLLHLRILCNPLKEIMDRLQRTKHDDRFLLCPRTDPSFRLGLKHRIVRRQNKISPPLLQTSNALLNTTMDITNDDSPKKVRRESLIFHEPVYIYFINLNVHIDQLIDSLEVQRESVAMLISLWLVLKNNETQEILKILMLVTVLLMPCILLIGLFSTNYHVQPQLKYKYGYYIVLVVLGAIISGMITLYKVKRWI